MADRDEVTRRLRASSAKGSEVVDGLMDLVYDDLRGYARAILRRGMDGAVDPTSIVHEAYLKLVHQDRVSYRDRRHFFAIAALAVRRILVDHARREGALKRGGLAGRTTLDARHLIGGVSDVAVLDLHEALEVLARDEPRAARLVELRFFGGLTNAEAAAQLDISQSTAVLDWRYARAWLYRRLDEAGGASR